MIPDDVLLQWELSGSQVKLGQGLINDTYCVDDRVVLQRINERVFTRPQRLIENFNSVYDHLVDLLPRHVPTAHGEDYFVDYNGDVWRCMVYYPSRNFQVLPDELAYAAGQAFGLFLSRLRTCDVRLEIVIPNFHDFGYYLGELEQVWREEEAEQIDQRLIERCRKIVHERSPTGPRQVIHGDCKINNLLFDLQSDSVVRIVDTDTLMWGYPVWDFGDLVRSIAMGSKIDRQLKTRLDSVCTGFFEQFSITRDEVDQYASAPIYMSMMLGVRFFTDHLVGNQYFKVERVGENRDRAVEQFELAKSFCSVYRDLESSIHSCIDSGASTNTKNKGL